MLLSQESWAHPVAGLHVPQPVEMPLRNLRALGFAEEPPGLGNWLLVLWAHLQEQPCSHTKESDSWMALPSLSFPFRVCFWSMPPSPIREGIGPSLSEKDAVASKFWQSVSTQERQLNVSVTLPRRFHTPCFSEFHRKELSDYPAWGVLPPFPMIHDSTRLYLSGTFWSLPKPFISYHTVLSPW